MYSTKPEELGLLTDLYELTVAQAYFQHGMDAAATFSLYIRNYPPNRSYFVSAGLEDVLGYLETFRFHQPSIDYLRSTGIFTPDFLDYLSGLRFTGDVWAIPEGRLFFTGEPVLEITGPIAEAQIVETYVINQINLQTVVATKAARCVRAAKGKSLVDFSLRRAQGTDAGMKVARASYMVGFDATSNVLAGKVYGIAVSGTMAHSFISSHEHELDAFRAFSRSFPDRSTFLIDTYDTLEGAKKAVVVAKEMEAVGHRLQAVRLDSGDLGSLSQQVRQVLDRAGLQYVRIYASGGLDEFDVEALTSQGAPIDGFGLGTRMGVSADAPWSDMAYKLVRYAGRPVFKLSTGKVSLPDEKQVFRFRDRGGKFSRDIISLRDEHPDSGEPLLEKVMEGGSTVGSLPNLVELRGRFEQDIASFDDQVKALRDPSVYEVTLSDELQRQYHRLERARAVEERPR